MTRPWPSCRNLALKNKFERAVASLAQPPNLLLSAGYTNGMEYTIVRDGKYYLGLGHFEDPFYWGTQYHRCRSSHGFVGEDGTGLHCCAFPASRNFAFPACNGLHYITISRIRGRGSRAKRPRSARICMYANVISPPTLIPTPLLLLSPVLLPTEEQNEL